MAASSRVGSGRSGDRPHLTVIKARWGSVGLHHVSLHRFPPLAAMTIEALARREGWDTELVDEDAEDLDLEAPTDLVALTTWTANAPRTYRIAAHYRAKGIPVIVGGVHPSMLPGEAARHADAVVVGECEATLGRVLADAAAGRLQRFYEGSWEDLSLAPTIDELMPRYERFPRGRYLPTHTTQTTRGCRFNCDFCSVIRINGRGQRHRDPATVVDELRVRVAMPGRPPGTPIVVFFTDDDLAADQDYCGSLFEAIASANLPVRFAAQTSIGLARNPELLKLAEAAGAALFFIGFESVDRQALKEANKKNRPGEFAALVQRLHDAHIAVEGGFIFGFDSDGPGVFADTVRAADEIGVDTAHFTILTPLPGTNTFSRLHEDGRIFDYDWSHYNAYRTLFQPARMSVATLDAGARWAYGAFYSKTARRRRTLAQIRRSSPVMAAAYRFVGGSYARHYGVGLQGSDERPFRPHPDDIANLAAVSDADANQVLIQALARVTDGASGSAGSSQPVAVELGRPAASATRG
ncbi:MAG: B12-binding domain-containing radical SAM protein [Microthrixaceae bacterium]|nr:B12-binding domain-containing radical SAM protein [Microthrixaceae bacterium]